MHSAELSVVVPTYKERGNVAELVRRLDAGACRHRLGSDFRRRQFARRHRRKRSRRSPPDDPRVRCLRRVGRRGLAGACIEGMLSSAAPFVAVMDADLQHDEKVLPADAGASCKAASADLVAATRYVEGGSAGELFASGAAPSRALATRLTRRLVGTPLSDPMSGFFMMRRDRFDEIAPRLSPVGFKILLDIVATGGERACASPNSPMSSATRFDGESKFNVQIGVEFLGLLLAKMTGDLVDPRFIFFAIVGTLGLVVHLVALRLALVFMPDAFRARPDHRHLRGDDQQFPAQQ